MKIWVVAGEASGDARGSELLRAIRLHSPDAEFIGAGGPQMALLAGKPFDDWIAEAGVVGLWDVLRHYGFFRRKFKKMLDAIECEKPDAVLLIDYPGFNLRLAAALRKRGFGGKILYYISPQVWAWHSSRIPKMAQLLDLMICVFPFEKPMFEASGLKTVFVGHPMLEAYLPERENGGVERESDLLGFFPGSRKREVTRHIPVFVETVRLVARARPHTRFAIAAATAEHSSLIRSMIGDLPIEVTTGQARDLMRRASAAIVCSGTASLEAAFFGLPYCLIYKVAWLTFFIGSRLVNVNCLGMVNILNNYKINPPTDPRLPAAPAPHIVKEFIQHLAVPETLAAECMRLLDSSEARMALVEQFQEILGILNYAGASSRAAQAILETLKNKIIK